MLPPTVVDRIAADYRLAGARLRARLHNSRENVAFRLATDQGRLVLRQLRARDGLERLSSQHSFMAYLAGSGFPVPAPLLTRAGQSLTCIEGVAYALYPLIEGRRFQRGNARHVDAAARALARYHLLATEYPQPMVAAEPDFREQLLEGVGRFPAAAAAVADLSPILHIARKLEYLRAAISPIEERMRRLPYAELPKVVIHGDYRRANLIARHDEVAAVLDFDRSRWEARVLDVAIAVSNLARGRYKKIFLDLTLVRTFMAAYNSVLPLEPVEMPALPRLIEAKVAMAALYRLARLGDAPVEERGKRAHKFRKHVKRLRWLDSSSPVWEHALEGR